MYDPTKIETWVVGASGFWHEGEVNLTDHMVRVSCTWEEVNRIYHKFMALNRRQYNEEQNLKARHARERLAFMADPASYAIEPTKD